MISHVSRFIDLNNRKFIIRPKPEDDELLSSWLVRVARAHLTHTTSFTNMHFKEYKANIIWQRDLDIWCPDSLIKRLSFKSGYSENIIFNMTLRSLEGIIADKITGKTNTPNIRALGNYCHIKTKGGLMYCPECLKEDKIAYFRKIWRLEKHSVCYKHNINLLDRCSNCLTPLTISKSYEEKSFVYCYKCGEKIIS
ncbi:MAG: hypothetical protein C0626_05025 [Arcobacter sp.]|uniref:TniQ family protein n=1 Tax=uncultured Arcobacter sp. TaxID=165434 RepID=UPI000CAD3850|nr:TniQ family protein [uncultured Arcobacter sp.]PLY10349.1 MAG: hypothetical protein C0626_05025 [Arcobacter sp.]